MTDTITTSQKRTINKVYIDLPENSNNDWVIKIIGFDGKQYLKQRLENIFSDRYPVDLTGYPAGLYIIVYQSETDYRTARILVRK